MSRFIKKMVTRNRKMQTGTVMIVDVDTSTSYFSCGYILKGTVSRCHSPERQRRHAQTAMRHMKKPSWGRPCAVTSVLKLIDVNSSSQTNAPAFDGICKYSALIAVLNLNASPVQHASHWKSLHAAPSILPFYAYTMRHPQLPNLSSLRKESNEIFGSKIR